MSISGNVKSTGTFLQDTFPGTRLTDEEPAVRSVVHTFPYTELTMVTSPYPVDNNMRLHMEKSLKIMASDYLITALLYGSRTGTYCLTDPPIARAMEEMGIESYRIKAVLDERVRGKVLMYERIMYRFAETGIMIWIE